MRNMLKIILIGISFLFSAQESYDEIDYLISSDNQYSFLPNRIEKIVNKLKRKGHYWQDIKDSVNKYIEGSF